jgi:hypothetical protein
MSLELVPSVHEILDKVKELTGKSVEFVEKGDLPTYAAIKLARTNMPTHLVFYRAKHNNLINHLIAHECGHALRMFGVEAQKRLMPLTNDQIKLRALTEIEAEVQRLSSVLPFDRLAQVVNLWYAGLVRQLTNLPPDIMIEKWLYSDYPELRSYQSLSMQKQLEESLPGLSRRVLEMTPRRISDASNIMNYAFFRILGQHFGVKYVRRYERTSLLTKGDQLVGITEAHVDSYEGDIEMINKWAEFLGLSNWFTWTDFENVPPGYERAF